MLEGCKLHTCTLRNKVRSCVSSCNVCTLVLSAGTAHVPARRPIDPPTAKFAAGAHYLIAS